MPSPSAIDIWLTQSAAYLPPSNAFQAAAMAHGAQLMEPAEFVTHGGHVKGEGDGDGEGEGEGEGEGDGDGDGEGEGEGDGDGEGEGDGDGDGDGDGKGDGDGDGDGDGLERQSPSLAHL